MLPLLLRIYSSAHLYDLLCDGREINSQFQIKIYCLPKRFAEFSQLGAAHIHLPNCHPNNASSIISFYEAREREIEGEFLVSSQQVLLLCMCNAI